MQKEIKVMIVEDEKHIAIALNLIVKKNFNCNEVVITRDGEEAWQMLMSETYDLVISDWNMPNKTGLELLQDMRQNPETRDIPFIMLTARVDKDSEAEASRAGVTDYIVKPYENDDVIEIIRKVLGAGRVPKI